ncbi:Major facilitator superfamily,Major facilitator superfamily domain [Cinara cedri]|uniref:Major facilitator superfamily,Major facilitator superfamily domain n=1 Tax=Cinara cedri TaxID=506608 RepID=A0A5E4MS14_9HEMI|nr:Major facilitator superfamily,Major facilitator superfamily domain [Cinara cedri]
MKFTLSEWIILAVVGSVHFCCAICISLQAPFYPEKAKEKGCTATQYGFVFGSFELVAFITSPIFGSLIQKVGLKYLLVLGIVMNALSTIAFGYLTYVDDKWVFLSLSLFLRILESLGATGAMVAAFSLTAVSFPESVASTFSALEVCYGMGYIVGPTLGALLFGVGGFTLPFTVMGFITLGTSVLVCILMKQDVPSPTKAKTKVSHLLSVPTVFVNSIATVIAASAMGYYSAVLEPHIHELVTPIQVGFVFIISGGTYALIAPIVGYVCDIGFNPKKIMILGTILTVISYAIVGPAPFVPLSKNILLVIIGLVIQGLALGMICVPTFVDSMTAAFDAGFPNDIHTYGLLSGIWSSSFALGAFLGPTIAGILYDLVGFERGTYFEIFIHIVLGIALMAFVCMERNPSDKFAAANGLSESTVGFAGHGDNKADPTPVPGGPKSPVYTINGHHSFRSGSAHRFGSTYGSFGNSCLGTSLSSMRINTEARAEARGSPLALASRI